MPKSNLLILVPSLEGGGAERVIIHLANNLDKEKFNLSIITVYPPASLDVSHLLSEKTEVYNLNKTRVTQAVPQIYKYIRAIKPDIVLSTLPAMNLWVSLLIPFLPKHIRFVARESSIPSVREKFVHPILYKLLYRTGFKRFDKIICLSEIMKNDLLENFDVPEEKMAVIWNFVDWSLIQSKLENSDEVAEEFDVITVGGLTKVKNHKLLLEAARQLPDDYKVGIIGEGPLRNELEGLIAEYALTEKVKLLGYKNNPYSYLRNAKMYVHTSLYEAGSPNAVIEAQVFGLPIIALDSHGGVREILELDVNGFLLNEADGHMLAELILSISQMKFNREEMGKKAIKVFDKAQSISKYEKAILGE